MHLISEEKCYFVFFGHEGAISKYNFILLSPYCMPYPTLLTYADVAVAPSLTRHPGSGELIVKKGSTVSLRCQAQGFPTPKVSYLQGVP